MGTNTIGRNNKIRVGFGMIEEIGEYLEEKEIGLEEGDRILVYTDGVTEARNPDEEMFGLERLRVAFKRSGELPVEEMVKEVHGDIGRFISSRPQYDDITLVGMEKG